MVNGELDYEINRDDKDKEQDTHPGEEIDSQENASEKAIDKRLGDSCPLPMPQMVKCYFSISSSFNSHN